jgi:hypothetical protein
MGVDQAISTNLLTTSFFRGDDENFPVTLSFLLAEAFECSGYLAFAGVL